MFGETNLCLCVCACACLRAHLWVFPRGVKETSGLLASVYRPEDMLYLKKKLRF